MNTQIDDKAARMLDIYATKSFQSIEATQRLRFTLALWVIRTKIRRSMKRLFDAGIAILAIIFTSPIIIGTAILIRLESPGSVVFKQTRIGKLGKPFTCYKFRSMYMDAEDRKQALMAQNEADGPVFKMKNDPRITRVGRIIRKLSIDELPQLLNVMKGEMSLVGPRPAVPQEVAAYEFDAMRRLEAEPGITGLQQVSGRSNLDFKRWIELDLQYISEQRFRKDVMILLKTIPAVLFQRGAY